MCSLSVHYMDSISLLGLLVKRDGLMLPVVSMGALLQVTRFFELTGLDGGRSLLNCGVIPSSTEVDGLRELSPL